MRTRRDYSYGVIPLYKTERGWQVLVINQYGSRGDAYWGFPKGHRERNEKGIDAARRELKEETGLTARLDERATFEQRYIFTFKGTVVRKKVTYYLGYVREKKLKLQERELAGARWCSFSSARELLTHDVTREMFDGVVERVEER